MATSRAAGARKDRDKSYRHVFKGSVLVTTLLDYDNNRFSNRQAAVKFAQKLLDLGQVESIVGKRTFEDGVALYRWCDETVVREAKKIAHTTTTTHIPKRRLIELLDLQQSEGAAEGYSVEKTRETFHAAARTATPPGAASKARSPARTSTPTGGASKAPSPRVSTVTPPTAAVKKVTSSPAVKVTSPASRVAGARRSAAAASRQPRAASTGPQQRRTRANLNNNNTMVKRDGSMSRTPGRTRNLQTRTPPAKSGMSASLHRGSTGALHRTAAESTESLLRKDGAAVAGTSSPTVELMTCQDMSLRPAASQASTSSGTNDTALQHTVDTSIERHVDKVLEGRQGASLAVPDDYDEFESDVFASPTDSPVVALQQPQLNGAQAPQTDDARASALQRPTASGVTSSTSNKTSSSDVSGVLANLTAQSSGFSDNEKQLLQQMQKMQEEHQKTVKEYEKEIKDLMATISELQKTIKSQQDDVTMTETGQKQTPAQTPVAESTAVAPVVTDDSKNAEPAPFIPAAPPPPTSAGPPAPPPPPLLGFSAELKVKSVAPTKAQIIPRVKMRPLFWSRILLGQIPDTEDDEPTFWHRAEEPNFDLSEFEKLFGKDPTKDLSKKKSLHELIVTKKETSASRQQNVKLLDENRSRAVGIKLRSLHCDMNDIRSALYRMDFTKLDVESIHGLYEIKGSDEEISRITTYLDDHPGASLDQPEQFLLELCKMPQFSERIECLIFRKSFNETLFNIDQQLDLLEQAASTLRNSSEIHRLLEIILAFGNYMNGGTQRGQADAYDLEVISKLKDVKSIDNSTNLLRHIVRIQSMEECDAGKNEAVYKYPDASTFTSASTVSFKEVKAELSRLKSQLKAHSLKADIVCLHSTSRDLQPFKDQMEDFFESAETMLKGQVEKMDSTKDTFEKLMKYFSVKDAQISPETFFGMWGQFMEDIKVHWKIEQKNIAKGMFNSVQDRRKERMRRRRESVKEDGRSSLLKSRLSNRRRQSIDSQSLSNSLFRSQSVCGVNTVGAEEIGDTPASTTIETRRSRRRAHAQSADVSGAMSMLSLNTTESLDMSGTSTDSFSVEKSSVDSPREPSNLTRSRSIASTLKSDGSESLGNRMRQRLSRNRIMSEDSADSPTHSPDVNPARSPLSRRTPDSRPSQANTAAQRGTENRTSSDGGVTPSTSERMKERMDRRRREREGTMSDSFAGVTKTSASSPKSSIDLATIRQKSGSAESGADGLTATERRAALHRSVSHADARNRPCKFNENNMSCDHVTCHVNRQDVSASEPVSRRQRREAWRSSQSNLSTDQSASPKLNKTDSWRLSHNDLSDVRSSISHMKPTRQPISWRSGPSSSVDAESSTARSAPASRPKQQSRPKSKVTQESISWRGSHQNLNELAGGGGGLRGRKESWRSSQGNLSSSANSDDVTLSRAKRREAWRSSHSNLSSSTADTSSPRLRRSSSRTAVHDVSTPDAGRLQRAGSRTSVADTKSEVTPRRRRESRDNSSASKQNESGVTSANDDDAAEYRERLRRVSRSRQNMLEAKQ